MKFVVFEETTSTDSSGSESWTIRFKAAAADTDRQALQSVHVCGVPPAQLIELRILDGDGEAFAIHTQYDSWGHACTAGVMLLAMYGPDSQGCLQVPAAECDRPISSDRAVVQLRIQGAGARSPGCVGVSAGPLGRASCLSNT